MPHFIDMLGREIVLEQPPQRIVSLVPSQTELLHDLGLETEVAGITKFCIHPNTWFRNKARVGGTKTVNIDKVKALLPDLIIANKEENTKEQLEALQAIAPVWISDIKNLEEALTMIREVSIIVGRQAAGQKLIEQIAQGFAHGNLNMLTRKKTAYAIWYNPWMWAGGDTFISDMLKQCNCENILESQSRYPSMNVAELKQYNPELVLLSSEPYPFKEQHILEVKASLPAAEVLLADGEMFSWYGSRLLHAPLYFKSLLTKYYD